MYALLRPASLEIFREGRYRNDFYLRCEPFSSIRLLPRNEAIENWRLPVVADGLVRECTEEEEALFLKIISKNKRVGFAPPPRVILDSIPRTIFRDFERIVPDQLATVLRTLAFGDVIRSKAWPGSLSRLGGVTLSLLKETHPELEENQIVDLLSALESLTDFDQNTSRSPQEIANALASLPPIVDTFLEEIDPDGISPRSFIAKSQISAIDWLDKTDQAEESHERILKDFVLFLKKSGYKTYKTRSFDLLTEKAGSRILWEVKSANAFNTVSQGEKGIIQLLRYSTALSDVGLSGLKYFLLLQDSGQKLAYKYLSKIAIRAGIELRLYNGSVSWPDRVTDLAGRSFDEN